MARRRRRRNKRGEQTFRDRLFMNLGLKLFVAVAVIITFLTLSQCTIKKPEAPTWSTTFNVPLIERTYDMQEIVRRIDEESLGLDSAGNPFFSIQKELDSLAVDVAMTAGNITDAASVKLGAVSITSNDIPPQTVAFADLIAFPPGVIPPNSFDFVHDSPILNTYSSVTVSNGSVLCEIANSMGVALDTVRIELYDLTTFALIGSGSLPNTLFDGEIDTVIIPLTNRTIGNRFRIQVHAHTPGGTVLSASGKELTTDIILSNPFSVSSGSAKLPGIDKQIIEVASLSTTHLVHEADLESGNMTLTMVNRTSLPADFTITLPDLNNNGTPFVHAVTLQPNVQQGANFDLAGYTLAPSDVISPQQIEIHVHGHIDSSLGFVNFTQNDSLSVVAQITNLSFASVRGVFDTIVTNVDPIQESIEVPTGFDSAQFTAATLTLDVENGSEMSGNLDLTVVGSNGKVLNVSGTVNPGSATTPVTTSFVESDLSDFLNPIPSSFEVSGSITYGDGVSVVDITKNDFVKSRVTIQSPLEVIFNGSTVQLDVERTDIDTADIDIVTDHLIEASINATVTNHLPAGLELYLYFSTDSANLYSAPQLIIGPISVTAGQTDGSGVTIGESLADNAIALTSADVQVFKNDPLFVGQLLTIASTNGVPAVFLGTDYINVSAGMSVEYQFDGDF